MPAPVTLTWGWEAGTASSQIHRVVLIWNGGSAVKKLLRIHLATVNSFCFKHSKRGKSDEWLLQLDDKPRLRSLACSLIRSYSVARKPLQHGGCVSLSVTSPFIVSSGSPCPSFPRTHPFSRYWLLSLYALVWPLLILSSSHLDGGLLIRPSGLLITTVSHLPSYIWEKERRPSGQHDPWGTLLEVFLEAGCPALAAVQNPASQGPALLPRLLAS